MPWNATAFAAILLISAASASNPQRLPEVMSFEEWTTAFGKEPLPERRAIFESNVAAILVHNAEHDRGETTWRMGVNAFADLTANEFKERFLMVSRPGLETHTLDNVVALPSTKITTVDWRAKGAVTPVKNQGACGSCWAFSATGAIESAYAIATGALRSLSEQQVMDCNLNCAQDSCGCEGGLPSAAFKYVLGNGGLDTDDDYNYTQIAIPCDTFESKRVAAKIESYHSVPSMNESQLLAAVTRQPISVGINALGPFQFYKSGILGATANRNCSCDDINCLDHAVLVVGYGIGNGAENKTEYWTVKNSWGAIWGESGYIRMARNVNDGYGQNTGLCGIAVLPTYPTVTKGPALPLPPLTPPHPSPRPKTWCGNCGEHCEYLCHADGLKCDSQAMDGTGTCFCMDASKPCHNSTANE